MVRKLVLAVAAASALMSSGMVQALGVGDINLRSSLNQPLDAEIELLQVRDLSSSEILPTLASPDDFGRAGIDRAFFLTHLTFTPVVRPDGRSVIRVTSSQPVNEPYLNFLMEVRWPSGRVLREFTLLLDPPMYQPTPVTAAAPISAPVSSPAPVVPVTRPAPVAPAVRPAAQPAVSAAVSGGQAGPREWRTSRSDTLWEIALRSRPQGASVQQTMLAIQDLNPGAFVNANINQLRAGQTLKLPDAAQAAGRNQSQAMAQVSEQNAAWQSVRRGVVAEPAQRQLDARERTSANAAPSNAGGDSLRLVAGVDEESTVGGGDSAGDNEGALQDALDRTKEQLDSAEREKAEMSERLADVQGQLDTLQRLLALKDAQLAAMQQEMGDDDAGLPDILPVPEETSAQLSSVESQNSDADIAAELAELDQAAALTGQEELPAVQPEAPVSAPENEVSEPVVAEQEQAPESPGAASEQESLLNSILQNRALLLGAGGVALLALLLLLMLLARRNARREADMADNFMARAANGSTDADNSAQDNDFNVALAGFDDSNEQLADLGIAEDPLTEADALIAYDKLDEAAEVLTAAIEQEPERTDLRLKLLEVEGLRGNQAGYAAQEQALQRIGGVQSQLDQLNARFPALATAVVAAAVSSVDEPANTTEEHLLADVVVQEEEPVDFDFSEFEAELSADALAAERTASTNEFDLDFDLDEALETGAGELTVQEDVPAAPADNVDFDLEFAEPNEPAAPSLDEDFDLSLTDELQVDSLLDEPQSESLDPVESVGQSFDLSDDDLAGFEADLQASLENPEALSVDVSVPATADVPQGSIIGDQVDDEDEFDFLSGTDECATKLDLARAYIDMGDEEGARDILAEVLEEGNEQQRQDAREMIGQLG